MTRKEVERQTAEKNAKAQQRCADYQTATQAVQRSFEGSTSDPPPEQKLIQQTLRLESVLRSQKAKAATHSQWYSKTLDNKQRQLLASEEALRCVFTAADPVTDCRCSSYTKHVDELRDYANFFHICMPQKLGIKNNSA